MGWNVNECPLGSDTDCEGQLGLWCEAGLSARQHTTNKAGKRLRVKIKRTESFRTKDSYKEYSGPEEFKFFRVILVNSLQVKIFKAESYDAIKEPNENKV